MKYRVGVVGLGYVGKGMHRLFGDWVVSVYDPFLERLENPYGDEVIDLTKNGFKDLDLAIICVPTNTAKDGWSCDTSIVESSVEWLVKENPELLILVKSTVAPGTVDSLIKKYGARLCFSPEFLGEGSYFVPFWKYPDSLNSVSHGFMIVGGKRENTKKVVDIFIRKMGPHTNFMQTNAKTAEVIKYMENIWGSQKVVFANEMYDCCEALGVDYREVREGWALDSRTEKMHTAVFENARGFAGKCFPKDLRAFISAVKKAGHEPRFLEEVVKSNNRIRKKAGFDEV